MFGKSTFLLALASVLVGCSHAGSIKRVSADYNRAMADVRNEQLLLNVMRASAREPLQFSAMGEIATTVNRTAGVDTALENLIAGGADVVKQTISLGANNQPVIKLTPLSNKEFIGGILRPTTPETVKQFMDLGWDPEFMLPLLVAGYQCPGLDGFQLNTGRAEGDAVRRKLTATFSSLNLRKVETAGEETTLVVADDKALEMVRSGLAGDYKVKSVTPAGKAGRSRVVVQAPAKSTWVANLDACGTSTPMSFDGMPKQTLATNAADPDRPVGWIKLRSVEGIIYFLGERYRDCYLGGIDGLSCAITYVTPRGPKHLFRVHSDPRPSRTAAVQTRFYDRHYWVSRLAPGEPDVTMKTWSFLNQLIALQTEPSAISTTPTVLPLGGK